MKNQCYLAFLCALVSSFFVCHHPTSLLAGPDTPAGTQELSTSAWSGISKAHNRWQHRFAEGKNGTYSAANLSQQWLTAFDGRGFLAEPEGEAWTWGLELLGYGVGDERQLVSGSAAVKANSERLSYLWSDGFEEWFRNDTRGLEQGWTLEERPHGNQNEQLRLDLAVRGGLSPAVEGDSRSVVFSDASGSDLLSYGGLKAWDAEGRDLPVRFLVGGDNGGISIEVDERGAIYPVTIDPVARLARITADNAGSFDFFGRSVAISGDTVAVGAENEAGAGDMVPYSGAVYVFVRNGANWEQQAYIRAFNAGDDDFFGGSVSLSGDTLIVGARGEDATAAGDPTNNGALNAGAAYVFTRSGTVWAPQARLKASDALTGDNFGSTVSVSGDIAVVGAPRRLPFNSGAAYVFEVSVSPGPSSPGRGSWPTASEPDRRCGGWSGP